MSESQTLVEHLNENNGQTPMKNITPKKKGLPTALKQSPPLQAINNSSPALALSPEDAKLLDEHQVKLREAQVEKNQTLAYAQALINTVEEKLAKLAAQQDVLLLRFGAKYGYDADTHIVQAASEETGVRYIVPRNNQMIA